MKYINDLYDVLKIVTIIVASMYLIDSGHIVLFFLLGLIYIVEAMKIIK